MDNSISHNGSKTTPKIKKSQNFQNAAPDPFTRYKPMQLWLSGMLKQIMRDREFSPSDEIDEAIAQVWNDLTFDDVQSVFRDWSRRLAWVAENHGEYISESNKICFLMSTAY
jgi:hypothetical protein